MTNGINIGEPKTRGQVNTKTMYNNLQENHAHSKTSKEDTLVLDFLWFGLCSLWGLAFSRFGNFGLYFWRLL